MEKCEIAIDFQDSDKDQTQHGRDFIILESSCGCICIGHERSCRLDFRNRNETLMFFKLQNKIQRTQYQKTLYIVLTIGGHRCIQHGGHKFTRRSRERADGKEGLALPTKPRAMKTFNLRSSPQPIPNMSPVFQQQQCCCFEFENLSRCSYFLVMTGNIIYKFHHREDISGWSLILARC